MDPLGYSWVVFHPPKKLQRTGGSTGYCKDVSNTKYHCATNASVGVAKGAERIRSSTNHWVSRHPSTMVNCLFSSIVYKSHIFQLHHLKIFFPNIFKQIEAWHKMHLLSPSKNSPQVSVPSANWPLRVFLKALESTRVSYDLPPNKQHRTQGAKVRRFLGTWLWGMVDPFKQHKLHK